MSLSVPIPPGSSLWSPHIPTSPSDGHSKPKGRKMVFGCVCMWAEGREGAALSQGTQMGAAALPKQARPFGSPWLCVKASGLLPTRNCAVKHSCTFPGTQADPGNPVPSSSAAQPLVPCVHPFSPMPAAPGKATAGSHGITVPIPAVSPALVQGKPHPDLFQLRLAFPNWAGFGQDVPGPASSSSLSL